MITLVKNKFIMNVINFQFSLEFQRKAYQFFIQLSLYQYICNIQITD
jgi:hypothetical protein